MLKTYTGSCHCGVVRIEADLDISAGTYKCNCTICTKARLWAASVAQESFRLIRGRRPHKTIRGKNPVAHHFFCLHCGVQSVQRVDHAGTLAGTVYCQHQSFPVWTG